MSEMNEKVEGPQEQAADRLVFRELTPEELQKILEAHRKWVESEGKEGEKADLSGADLRGANLEGASLWEANLGGVDLTQAIGLTKEQFRYAKTDKHTILPDYLKESGHEK